MFTPQDMGLPLLFLAGCVLKSLICRDNCKIIKKPIHSVFKHCCLSDSREDGELCGAVTGSFCKKGQY